MRELPVEPNTIRWLLDSDPAIRWQVMRDLLDAESSEVFAERNRLTQTGWCAQLLKLQDDDGLWSANLYNGKWVSTTYTLYLLKLLGLPAGHAQAMRACKLLLDGGLYEGGEIRFSRNRDLRDLGVTAMVLSLCCYFRFDAEALHNIAQLLMGEQRPTGEWLPSNLPAGEDYAFETTLLVLEALRQYHGQHPDREQTALTMAMEGGQEFLLQRQLFLRDGKPIKPRWTTFSFPPYWFYDALTALDYYRFFWVNCDERLLPAIDLLKNQCNPDGRWSLGPPHPGKTYFTMEQTGKPSRWNTLRALRILRWWDRGYKEETLGNGR